jgi:hypothetical protein
VGGLRGRGRAMLARADVGAGFVEVSRVRSLRVYKSPLLKRHITSILLTNQVLLP